MDSQRNMSEISRQLNLDMGTTRTSFMPKTISDILTDLSLIRDSTLKSSKLDFHVHLLEEELKKIDAFKRELPYCMQILQDAIEMLKKELFRLREIEEAPMLVTQELLPLQSDERIPEKNDGGVQSSHDLTIKKTWMSSFRLWNAPVKFQNDANEPFLFSSPSRGGEVAPLKRSFSAMKNIVREEKGSNISIGDMSLPVTVEAVNVVNTKPFKHKQHKKQRRCWSNLLHKQFSDALQCLGGPKKSTPKQIRELMKVNDLTNDEVKSHLQKYRLHLKKKAAQQKLSAAQHFNEECSAARGGDDGNGFGKAVLHY